MLKRIYLRFVFPALAAAALVAPLSIAQSSQSQDSQPQDSVAEAARRAREKNKAAAKPAKVITDDDVKPAAPEGSAANPAVGGFPSGPEAAKAQSGPGASGASGEDDQEKAKEIAALKEQIKQVQGDLEFLKRDMGLQQDTYYSNPDYVHDTAGKAKLDGMKQQVADKQEELNHLKDQLAELGGTLDNPAAAPAAPGGPAAPAPANPPTANPPSM